MPSVRINFAHPAVQNCSWTTVCIYQWGGDKKGLISFKRRRKSTSTVWPQIRGWGRTRRAEGQRRIGVCAPAGAFDGRVSFGAHKRKHKCKRVIKWSTWPNCQLAHTHTHKHTTWFIKFPPEIPPTYNPPPQLWFHIWGEFQLWGGVASNFLLPSTVAEYQLSASEFSQKWAFFFTQKWMVINMSYLHKMFFFCCTEGTSWTSCGEWGFACRAANSNHSNSN